MLIPTFHSASVCVSERETERDITVDKKIDINKETERSRQREILLQTGNRHEQGDKRETERDSQACNDHGQRNRDKLDRDRERQTGGQKETDKQTESDGQKDRNRQTQIDGQTQAGRERDMQTDRHIYIYIKTKQREFSQANKHFSNKPTQHREKFMKKFLMHF